MILLVNNLKIYIVIDFICIFLNLLTYFLVSFIIKVLLLKIFWVDFAFCILLTLLCIFVENEVVLNLLLIWNIWLIFELIIIDGGSEDGSLEIIKKYEKNITFWISEKDHGQSDALNKGFSYATGDIYGWLNSDDLYLPGAFILAKEFFAKSKDKKI